MATDAILFALITAFADSSGAHFNPVVTIAEAWLGRFPWREVMPYMAAQAAGAALGVALAHGMFELPLFEPSRHARSGQAQWLSECVATFGLLTVILAEIVGAAAAVLLFRSQTRER